jgi:hypothetical protein
MATIVIRDLQESAELDRKAMLAISGGARRPARGAAALRLAAADTRIVRFRPQRPLPGGGRG